MKTSLVFALLSALASVSATAQGDTDLAETLIQKTRGVSQETRTDVLAISEYQTNYFISGEPDTKIQLSFQFRLFQDKPVIFAYTQKMFWELYQKSSSPFSDVNFMPELFYRLPLKDKNLRNIEMGYHHLSNGRSEPDSRTVDSVFARFHWKGLFFSSLNLRYHFSKESLNRDYTQFVGPVELQLQLKNFFEEKLAPQDFYGRIYTGGDWGERLDRISVELGVRYRFFGSDSSPGIFFQYFRGYGEKILTYNQRDESYRIGFSVGGDYRTQMQNTRSADDSAF